MISTPTFVLGLILIYIFGVQLRILPIGGMFTLGKQFDPGSRFGARDPARGDPRLRQRGAADALHAGRDARGAQQRLRDDGARQGPAPDAVLIRHGFRNALLPIITVIGLLLPELVAGAIITEQVFSWPGMGLLAVRAAAHRDPSLMMGIVLIVSIAVLVTNIVADFAYTYADPRVRLDRHADAVARRRSRSRPTSRCAPDGCAGSCAIGSRSSG